jgi:hypothetical protein
MAYGTNYIALDQLRHETYEAGAFGDQIRDAYLRLCANVFSMIEFMGRIVIRRRPAVNTWTRRQVQSAESYI